MGVVSLPSLDNYCPTDIVRSHPWFWTVIPRDTFCLILCYIHVADNSKAPQCDDPGFDKLWKICGFHFQVMSTIVFSTLPTFN